MTDILSTGASAVQLYQKTLATVSNNVANLNTEGYSRQEAVSRENNPSQIGVHFLGSGAGLQAIKRNYDEFVETNLRSTLTDFSTFTPLVDYTSRIFDVFASDINSLTSAFDRFFNVAEKLTLQPDGLALRSDLLSAGDSLASKIKYLAKNLSDLDAESGQELQKVVETANSLTAQLARVNQQLGTQTAVARQPAALLDQRDRLLKSLSSIFAIDVTEEPNGVVNIDLSDAGSAGTLLNRAEQKKLTIDFIANRPGDQRFVVDKYGDPQNLAGISSGKLGGIASFRSDVLAPLMDELDYLSGEFVTNINLAHREGVNLNNERGGDLFTIKRQFTLVDTSQAQIKGVRFLETDPAAAERNIELAWMGSNNWLVRDIASNQQFNITGTDVSGGGHVVTFDGLQMTFSKFPDSGTALNLRSTRKASQGIAVALTDPTAIAAANRIRLSQPESNTNFIEIAVSYAQLSAVSSYENAISLNDLINRNVPVEIFPSDNTPALHIPAGISNFMVSFMPPVNSDQTLQLITREFNHLLGAEISDATLLQMADSDAIYPGSRYLNSNLNLLAVNASVSGNSDFVAADYSADGSSASFDIIIAGAATASENGIYTITVDTDFTDVLYSDFTADTADAARLLTQINQDIAAAGAGEIVEAKFNDTRTRLVFERKTAETGGSISVDNYVASANTTTAAQAINFGFTAGRLSTDGTASSIAGADATGEQVYRQNDYFYGHKAAEFSLSMAIPVQANTSGASQTLIAEGNLILNGEVLPALTLAADATLTAEDIAAWINTTTTDTGVSASVSDGRVLYTGSTVTFSFGIEVGKASDLSRIGLATGVYSSRTTSEDLLVYVTGSDRSQIELQVQAGNLIAAPSVDDMDSPFSIRFTDDGDYQIWDDVGDSLVAQRAFDLDTGIVHNGIVVTFDEIPAAGDRFDLTANTDSAGDNRNLQGMLGIRSEPLVRGQSINDFYIQKINNVANVLKISKMNLESSEVIYEQAEIQKSTIAGVNLDQEAADLIRFQQAYQAAAQIIQASIKMFDTLLNTSR